MGDHIGNSRDPAAMADFYTNENDYIDGYSYSNAEDFERAR